MTLRTLSISLLRRFVTHPPTPPPTPPPKTFRQIEPDARVQLFNLFAWARLAISPVIGGAAAWIGFNDAALWRQCVMGFIIVALLAISLWDVILVVRRKPVTPFVVHRNAIGAGLATLALVFSTGAIESPFLPVVLMIGLVTTVGVSPRLGRFLVLGFQIPSLWLFAIVSVYDLVPGLIPDVFGGGTSAGRDHVLLWATAVIYTFVLTGIISGGVGLRRKFAELLTQSFEERDEALRMHQDQNRALMALSGEIAHELKNPLASVKGLAALVARALEPEGKPAERMTVLRREVDRMQTILEEFLNFSRPLAPLSQERTDLAELCRDVAELHEGVGRERGVAVEVRSPGEQGGGVAVTCDRRKVKQALINVVQNALEASPPGARVAIEAAASDDGGAVVRVIDEGPGLAPGLGGRAFEPGVTGKAKGSGLGLTVARAIARQHGGELTLRNGEAGGCVAELVLPSTIPAAGPGDGEAAPAAGAGEVG